MVNGTLSALRVKSQWYPLAEFLRHSKIAFNCSVVETFGDYLVGRLGSSLTRRPNRQRQGAKIQPSKFVLSSVDIFQ